MSRSNFPKNKPLSTDLRPLEAKTLKSIMDTLQFELLERNVLDLYAGSGRFSQACLDRGASRVVLVELSGKNARALGKSFSGDSGSVRVVCKDVIEFLATDPGKYSLVFADPPFRIWSQELAETLLSACASRLSPEGILLVRYPKRVLTSVPESTLSEAGLTTWKQKTFGESVLWYLRAEAD